MRTRLVACLAFLAGLIAGPALATCPTYPFTLTNGQTADANQVMANFNAVLACVNAQPTITLPLPVADGGTGSATIVWLQPSNNLSDVFSPSISLTNLGGLAKANNLSDVASATTSLANLGGLAKASNLSDLASAATARTNLGLGTAATQATSAFLQPGNNLSDVGSAATARTNLGVAYGTTAGTVAQGNDSRFAGPTQNSQSVNYTFALSDAGGQIYHPSADTTARTWTIPANASVAYAVGTKLELVNDCSAGVITLAITSDTLEWFPSGGTGSRSLAACSIAQLTKVTPTKWVLTGVGVS